LNCLANAGQSVLVGYIDLFFPARVFNAVKSRKVNITNIVTIIDT